MGFNLGFDKRDNLGILGADEDRAEGGVGESGIDDGFEREGGFYFQA